MNVWVKGKYLKKKTGLTHSIEYICSLDELQLEIFGGDAYNVFIDDRPTNRNTSLHIRVDSKEWHRLARLKMAEGDYGVQIDKEPVKDNLEGIEV